jgi:hypothetical protein
MEYLDADAIFTTDEFSKEVYKLFSQGKTREEILDYIDKNNKMSEEENNDLSYKNIPPPPQKEQVNHPQHYGGGNNVYETIKVIDNWQLGFNLGNTIKYISRAGKKDPKKELEDLRKAKFYLDYHIKSLEEKIL